MPEENVGWSIPIYLDASAAVKLFVNEDGSVRLEDFIGRKWAAHLHITEFAFYETLGVFKKKLLRAELDRDRYFNIIAEITGSVEEREIEIDSSFRPDSFHHFADIYELAAKHSLDWSDALQVYTVLKGKWAGFRYESTAMFITADQALANAAKLEGLRVWNLAKEDRPSDDPGLPLDKPEGQE